MRRYAWNEERTLWRSAPPSVSTLLPRMRHLAPNWIWQSWHSQTQYRSARPSVKYSARRLRLRLAQMSPSSSKSTDKKDKNDERLAQAERQAAIQNAKLTLQSAQDRLRAIQSGPPPAELAIAQRNLVTARSTLQAAQERLEQVKQGPDTSTLAQAKIAVDSARLAFESATARLSTLQAGPDPAQQSAATSAYQSAVSALRSAEAQQAEVLARPTRAELDAAEDSLKAARDRSIRPVQERCRDRRRHTS